MKTNTPQDDDQSYVIELKNVGQSYPDREDVIKDVSFTVDGDKGDNKFVVILGPSGCGKSTLLRYISGLQVPTKGGVFLHGKPITNETIVGMVFQKYSSLPWYTVLENVALGLELQGVPSKERNQRAMEMIKTVDLMGQENKHAHYPILSGGQLQRVAIARSLLASPKILLMDEPFGALDVKTRLHMQEMLKAIMSKMSDMTVVFVTHDIPEAVFLGDEILIMDSNPGRIVEKITVNLPENRTKEIKREAKFVKMVYDIEDKMESLSK